MLGLTDEKVKENREKYGSNELIASNKNSFLKLLIESLGDPIIKILLIALAIKVVFLFKNFDWYETIGILIAIMAIIILVIWQKLADNKKIQELMYKDTKMNIWNIK